MGLRFLITIYGFLLLRSSLIMFKSHSCGLFVFSLLCVALSCVGNHITLVSFPNIGLSESDSKIYTNFEFCEGKKLLTFGKHIDLQSQAIYLIMFTSYAIIFVKCFNMFWIIKSPTLVVDLLQQGKDFLFPKHCLWQPRACI